MIPTLASFLNLAGPDLIVIMIFIAILVILAVPALIALPIIFIVNHRQQKATATSICGAPTAPSFCA